MMIMICEAVKKAQNNTTQQINTRRILDRYIMHLKGDFTCRGGQPLEGSQVILWLTFNMRSIKSESGN